MTQPASVSHSSAPGTLTRALSTPVWIWLILAGIALNTAFNVLANRAMRGDPDSPVIGDLLTYKLPPLAVNIGRLSLAIILLGAVLCAAAPAALRIERRYRILLWAFIGYSVVLAARNLLPQDFLTFTIYSPLAPGCAIASCLILAAADKSNWGVFARTVAYGSVGVSLIALFEVARLQTFSRAEAYWHLYTYASILEITAIVAFGWFAKAHKIWLGAIPIGALIAVAIVMQTRLMVVEIFCLLSCYAVLARPRVSGRNVFALCLVTVALLWTAYAIWYSPVVRSFLPDSAAAFWERRAEDTRSAQLVNFFRKVPASTFVWGIGIPRPGEFNGLGSKGIDLGYVNILFIGGIPALALFLILHIWPAVRSLGRRLDPVDAACVASVITYGVRLCSSTVPTLGSHYCIFHLLAGRCIILLKQKHSVRVVHSRSPLALYSAQPDAAIVPSKVS